MSTSARNAALAAATEQDARWASVVARDPKANAPFVCSAGAQTAIRFAVGECSLGSILVAQSERGICAIFLGDDPETLARELRGQFSRDAFVGGDAEFEQLVSNVATFIEAPAFGFDLPLDIRGTAFQQRVWQALREIPPGSTASYSDIANRIGSPSSAKEVGEACAANSLAVLIPCHRVVRKDGGLSGYRWGIHRKRALLNREAQAQHRNHDRSIGMSSGIERSARTLKPNSKARTGVRVLLGSPIKIGSEARTTSRMDQPQMEVTYE